MFGSRGFSPYSTYGLGTVTKSGINWSSLLNNTQKTLGIINQAIPAFYQIKPIFNNMKTMFKVVNEMNRDDIKINSTNNTNNNNQNNVNDYTEKTIYDAKYLNEKENTYSKYQDDGPSFFV